MMTTTFRKNKSIAPLKAEKREPQPDKIQQCTGVNIDKSSDKTETKATQSATNDKLDGLCHNNDTKKTINTATTTTSSPARGTRGALAAGHAISAAAAVTNILRKVVPAPSGVASKSSSTARPSPMASNKWTPGTKLETTCNILSKSSSSGGSNKSTSPSASSSSTTSSTASSSSSRPDLSVASSTMPTAQSTSQVINFKTFPLLMNHNHHHQATTSSLTGSKPRNGNIETSNSNKATAKSQLLSPQPPPSSSSTSSSTTSSSLTSSKGLMSTLTPQIILSQLINTTTSASSPVSQHSTFTSANLEGLQFCLNTTSVGKANNANVLRVQSLTTAKSATKSVPVVAIKRESSASPTANARGAGETKTKVKLHAQSGSKNANPIGSLVSDQGDVDSANANGTNLAAARLLDLGKRLLEATREGKLEQVRNLVEDSGAPFTSDWLGTTALHFAAQGGHMDIAKVLVRAGVNRDARTKLERTALHLAAQSGSLEIVDLLLTHGSDVNARDMLRMTPLHWAVERGHVYVAERLLISGADAELTNKFLLTPLDIARDLGSVEMIELFKNWTGDESSPGGDGKAGVGALRDDQNLEAYANSALGAGLNESHQDFLDIDYHLALVDSATNSRGAASIELNNGGDDDPCIDLIEFEWNKIDFDPNLFLPSETSDEEQKVDFLMKVVEDLKKENRMLKEKVEQLSSVDE